MPAGSQQILQRGRAVPGRISPKRPHRPTPIPMLSVSERVGEATAPQWRQPLQVSGIGIGRSDGTVCIVSLPSRDGTPLLIRCAERFLDEFALVR